MTKRTPKCEVCCDCPEWDCELHPEFKGLEKEVLILVLPNIDDFKEKYPERVENFMMQLYVGASRAKFKLYFFEYKLK